MLESIFNIPELVTLLAEHLDPHDVFQCILINRRLHQILEPLLYRRLIIRQPAFHRTIGLREMEQRILSIARAEGGFSKVAQLHLSDMREIEICVFASQFLQALTTRNKIQQTEADPNDGAGDQGSIVVRSTLNTTTVRTCTRLRRLKLLSAYIEECEGDHDVLHDTIVMLLNWNPNLTELYLPSSILSSSDAVTGQFFLSLKTRLPNLKKLSVVEVLGAGDEVPLGAALLLLHASLGLGQLQALEWAFEIENEGDHNDIAWPVWEQLLISDKSLDNASFDVLSWTTLPSPVSAIKTLVLPVGLPMKVQAHVLLNCVPKLVKLSARRILNDFAGVFLEAITSHCQDLRHLIVGWVRGNLDQLLPAVLEACRRPSEEQPSAGLQSLCIEQFTNVNDADVYALLQHSDTLEELSLHGSDETASKSVPWILYVCSRLIRFSFSHAGKNGLKYDDVLQEPWACSKLRFLHLTLSPTPQSRIAKLAEMEKKRQRKMCGLFFGRIGELEDLRELELDYGSWGLDKNRGDPNYYYSFSLPAGLSVDVLPTALKVDLGLKQLGGLKKMRRLKIAKDLWQGMSQGDCEFIAREWPVLNEIELHAYDKQDYWEACDEDHWRWFRRNRPGVRLTCSRAYPIV